MGYNIKVLPLHWAIIRVRAIIWAGAINGKFTVHYAVKPGTWFSRFLDLESRPEVDLENSPFSLVGVTVSPGFDLKDLQSAKLSEIQ